ncbi:phage tail sheath subtilisin-like domain-containing protein [Paenibacillus naphthalenovorans]|uniref:phage tail sheath subtilisin-like domain-containing protein n=1 Tax=Paenibacillus naphthalenovorans TaxID=162209 RepID=UPI003D26E160
MPKEYIVPRVDVDESDVGPRPTGGVSLGKIGIVGTFAKGPVNTPVTIGSVDQFVQTFGEFRSDLTGPLSMLGALNQGATDFAVVRIGGDSLATASLVLKDDTDTDSVIVEATSPGKWGNDIKVSVTAGSAPDTVKLVVISGNRSTSFDNVTLDNVEQFKTADVIFKKAAGATKLPKLISATKLSGGDDGANAEDADYIGILDAEGNRTGLRALDPVRCAIVIAAQQSSAAVQAALLTHAANAGLDEGLRMVVLNTPKGTSVDAATALTATLDSMRAIMAYPWVEPQELAGMYVAPDGYYAGRLSQLPAHHSPSNKQVSGILSTERLLTYAEVKALTEARISPITLVEGRGFRIRNGVTLSSDPAWNQTNIRRIFDKIEMAIYRDTQWAISEPHTPKTWSALAAQIDSMLAVMKQNEEIFDFKPTVCDETNNPPEMVQARILNTRIRVRPVYAADFIDHSIQRLVGNE